MPRKFQPPRGTRDFMPEEMLRREYVIGKAKNVFESFGFRQMETPAFESWELLGAKGGGGEAIKDEIYLFKDKGGREMGLRFDLTVPAARVVASNPQLPLPFKRYQIGPVWRYDNPQSGRFREFRQADIDTFGAAGMEADAEIIAASIETLRALGFKDFKVRLNNRKIISYMTVAAKINKESMPAILRILDKKEKTAYGEWKKQMEEAVGEKCTSQILSLIGSGATPAKNMKSEYGKMKKIQEAKEGFEELEKITEFLEAYGGTEFVDMLEIDLSLVRGLDYYTGPIFEISGGGGIGSLAGGGRYDRLIGIIGGREEPAVGISFGIERICELMRQKAMFRNIPATKTRVFIATAGAEPGLKKAAIEISCKLRSKGIPAETDLMGRKLKQCMEYAARMGIPYMLIIGDREMKTGRFTLRDMEKREQKALEMEEIARSLG